MFNGSLLRVCRILQFVKKIRSCLLESGRTKPWCAGLVSRPSAKGQVPFARSRGQWQGESFQQVRQPSISSSVEEDTSKIRDTTGTVFIQGPSIVQLVWRSIMFNGSFLRVCRILQFVKKIRFCLFVPHKINNCQLQLGLRGQHGGITQIRLSLYRLIETF